VGIGNKGQPTYMPKLNLVKIEGGGKARVSRKKGKGHRGRKEVGGGSFPDGYKGKRRSGRLPNKGGRAKKRE